MDKIMIAAPIHNREWVIDRYLGGIESLNYNKCLIDLFFIVNDSQDNTFLKINRFKERWKNYYNNITVINHIFDKDRVDSRTAKIRHSKTYGLLAWLRNNILSAFLRSECDYLLQVDSDIILESETLNQLLSHEKDCVAALIKNGAGNRYNFLDYDSEHDIFLRKNNEDIKNKGLLKVDLTGACMLINRRTASAGKYKVCRSGEDEGFCRDLIAGGIEMFVDTNMALRHLMEPEEAFDGAV